MKRLLVIFILITVLTINNLEVFAEQPAIDSGSCILIDSKTGQVLYEKNSDAKGLFPASTTKIMTALLALEKGKLDSVMTASQAAISDIGKDGSNIGLMAGEEMKMEELLKALLISSANETANVIAENICATRQEFVELMNAKAKELGAFDTNFTNPCGAHDSNHYTTALDMSKIARYAMTFPKFREIVQTVNYQLSPTNKHGTWPVLATTNKLMQYTENENYRIIGVKTGYTGPAGYNLVSAAVNNEGMELISVVMNIKNDGAQSNVKLYTKELFNYGFNNYSTITLLDDNQVYKSFPVEDAEDDILLNLITKGKIEYLLPKDTSLWNLEITPTINNQIIAPVNKGDYMGSIEYKSNGKIIGKVELIAARDVKIKPQAEFMNNLELILSGWIIKVIIISLCIIIPFFFILRFVLRTISRRIRARKRG